MGHSLDEDQFEIVPALQLGGRREDIVGALHGAVRGRVHDGDLRSTTWPDGVDRRRIDGRVWDEFGPGYDTQQIGIDAEDVAGVPRHIRHASRLARVVTGVAQALAAPDATAGHVEVAAAIARLSGITSLEGLN